jgi:excinuclease UvrABC nuclease subunit
MPNTHNNRRTKLDETKTSGVYQIINTITGESYIGQSKHIEARWEEHKQAARHPLYSSMAKYGENAFEFKVLEECDNHLEKERHYIELMNPKLNSHRAKLYRAKLKKPVRQIDPETSETIREFESQTQAEKITGIPQPQISACITGRQPTAGGYIWEYVY